MTAHARQIAETEDELLDRLAAAEAQLATLRDALAHQQRLALIGTLAAGIAHETNNLLTPVLAYTQLAESHPDQPELLEKLRDRCAASLPPATEVAHAILSLASPSDQDETACVMDAANKALACLGRDLAKDKITCTIDIPEDLTVRAKPLALQQVLLNLLLNAVTALQQQRHSTIRIHAAEDETYVCITVEDNGPGIPEAIRGKLFQPFSVSRETHSNGLGLWMCKELIEQAGGTIDLTTAIDAGTAFHVTLPAA